VGYPRMRIEQAAALQLKSNSKAALASFFNQEMAALRRQLANSRGADCRIFSRYLTSCRALGNARAMYASTVFERASKDFGLPASIGSDDRTPCASAGIQRSAA
jgi:hypothetical protein